MSELHSLYVRVHLSKRAYQKFMDSRCANANVFGDWMEWLGGIELVSGPMTPKRVAEYARRGGPDVSVGTFVAQWCAEPENAAASRYDEATETWQFCVLQFSENYGEFLEFLPSMRAACFFKDRPGDDFLVVYPFIWDTGHTVCFSIDSGHSRFLPDFAPAWHTEANTELGALMDDLGVMGSDFVDL
ncbi:hypothetical protein [Rhodoferax sp. WC2427]|uniref:hypothetical protein n=1 Tax=Rhodoferax sp. WC2427 TaxID=3234144 RepID=UPI0034656FB9